MRPSQYHYIKRMWMRNLGKKKKRKKIKSISKKKSSSIKKNTNSSSLYDDNTIHVPTLEEMYAQDILLDVKELANTINTTTDKIIFEKSLKKIKDELQKLIQYENLGIFVNGNPSDDLDRILKHEHLTRKKFEERSKKLRKKEYDKLKELDPYIIEAGIFATEKCKLTIASLQRVFKIGLYRAEQIMNQLEILGVVSSERKTVKDVIMSTEEFQNIIPKIENKVSKESPVIQQKKVELSDWEKYAIMCNTLLEEEDKNQKI